MAGKVDVHAHLDSRRAQLTDTFDAWDTTGLSPSDRGDIVEHYFSAANVGTTRRVGTGTSVLAKARRSDPHRPNVLVLGRHHTAGLADRSVGTLGPSHVRGPGVASRLGPTMAFCEGMQAADRLLDEPAVNLTYLSVGDGDTFTSALSHVFTGNLDAVFITNATQWRPGQPTITTGCRGRIVAELTLAAGPDVDDFMVSGGVRNPLKMTQLLGSLRDDRGRIALAGFYERAVRPDAARRSALGSEQPAGWAQELGIAQPSGSLTSLERASMWPGVSVLAIETSSADGHTAPGTVRATIAIYLVPDQRHAEVERSLRSWFEGAVPADLQPSLHIVESTRPFVVDASSGALTAQTQAAFRLFGSEPALVPAGGEPGAGELAFSLGVPVAFAGIAAPSTSTMTHDEQLAWTDFAHGTSMAAETALQMRRV